MKKLVLILCITAAFAVAASAADGPVDRGSLVLDGSVHFAAQSGELHESPDGGNYWSFGVSPSVGYFIAPGLLVGLEAGFFRSSSGDYSDFTGYHVGPFIGYYFNAGSGRTKVRGAIYPFVIGSFGYQRTVNNYQYTYWDLWGEVVENVEWTLEETQFGGEAGAIFMVSNAVGVKVSGLVTSESVTTRNDLYVESEDSNKGVTFMLGAGITYFIY